MDDQRRFYNLNATDSELIEDHKVNCACCGGNTEDISEIMGKKSTDVYKCDVCEMRINMIKTTLEVLAEPRRVQSVLIDKYDQYDWKNNR